MKENIASRVEALAQPVAEGLGYELFDVEYVKEGPDYFLRLYITKEGGIAKVVMTLTAPNCPVAGDIMDEVQQKVAAIDGVTESLVELTFDPPWNRDMMTEEAKLELGLL